MTVRELIEALACFDDDMKVVIGMQQRYGTDFAMDIRDVEEYKVLSFYDEDYKAVVITEGEQDGSVDYSGEYDD